MQKLKYPLVEEKLNDLGLKIFTALDLCQLFGASKRASDAFLSYNARRGLLIRLKQGFYSFSRSLPHDFLIANKIYSPSYVSLDTALSFYSLIPETVYSVISVTTKKTNRFLVGNKEFVYHKIKTSAFLGYKLTRVDGEKVYLATPEKAVADLVYFMFLKRKNWYERLDFEKIVQKRVEEYLNLLGGEKLIDFWHKLKKKYD